MYIKSTINSGHWAVDPNRLQGLAASDAIQYQDTLAAIQRQLERKFRDPNDPRLYERRKELRRLFDLIPRSYSETLYDRLQNKMDSLGRLLHYKLSTPTRNEMLMILRNKLNGAGPSPTNPGSKVSTSTKLARAKKLAKKLALAKKSLEKAGRLLKTKAQRDLFNDLLVVLSTFVPTGYGAVDRQGTIIQSSRRNRLEVLNRDISTSQPPYFHYDTWLHLSEQDSTAVGIHRPFAPNHRNWIRLYIKHLESGSASYIAEAVIHELMHMVLHRFRSIQSKFGKDPAANYPTREAGALLDVSSLDSYRLAMQQHFVALVKQLNQQSQHAHPLSLDPKIASQWADHLVDEVMAYVFQDRVRMAISRAEARGKGIVVFPFEPITFLRNYFLKYWLKDPNDRIFINSDEGKKLFNKMTPELKNLVTAVETQIGP